MSERSGSIYAHFHPDERVFVDRAQEWVERAAQLHEVKVTDFLDPRQAFIVRSLVNREPDVACRFEGGGPSAERTKAIIAPDYRNLEAEDAGIAVLAIESADNRFSELDHDDFMGAILGLGLKRDKIGDIHVGQDVCHVVIASETIRFVNMHLQQVHRAAVRCDILPIGSLRPVPVAFEEMSFTVASLRLDGIIGDAYRLSRAKALEPIQAGRCRVNWKPEENPSKELKAGDVVSLKGFGRFKLLEIDGMTKKGRIRVTIGKYS